MSKEKMLAAVKRNKPQGHPLPEIPAFQNGSPSDLVEVFTQAVSNGGGQCFHLHPELNLEQMLQEQFPDAKRIASTLPFSIKNVDLDQTDAHALRDIDLAILPAQLGVAENGAVWLSEQDCGQRVLPFITQHLIVLVSKGHLVFNMHQAYQNIKVDATGFGLFVAGPSKTADIEQSLVIGAQGARSFTVFLQ